MSDTILRLGLWILILVLAVFILAEANYQAPWAELIPHDMLKQVLVLAFALIVAGIVANVLGKGIKSVSKNRCQVCRTPIPDGSIYCREHLRTILHEEDEKMHSTRIR